jgi:uncharacterized protein
MSLKKDIMRILVDADSCPVKEIIVDVAQKFGIPVIMFIDTSHIIDDGCSEVIVVDRGKDSVDIALINRATKGDIVITGDYGVAALALAKDAVPVSHQGHIFNAGNIDRHLFERYLGQKIRRSGGRTTNPKARRRDDDRSFEKALASLCSGNPEDRRGVCEQDPGS